MNRLLAGLVLLALAVPVAADVEQYRVRLENRIAGTIEVSTDEGMSWLPAGQVLYPTTKTDPNGFAAARWMEPGRVAATAVNAIHIKTGTKEASAAVFSILPKEFAKSPDRYNSYFSRSASIYTTIPGGEGIFGGGFAPYVGNVVKFGRGEEKIKPLPENFVPVIGDVYYILVIRPAYYPKEIVFDNHFGGAVTVKYFSGEERVIGEVLRPVAGIGRFEGSRYTGPGRIRANHPGVIDVSTSPDGQVGGFQIVPSRHANEMGNYVKEKTQWLVIGPKAVSGPALEGMPPFFRGFIKPAYDRDDLRAANWEEKLLARFLVEVKLKGSDQWQPMPVSGIDDLYLHNDLPKWCDTALNKVTAIRILFPVLI